MLRDGDTMKNAHDRISKVYLDGQCCGTVVRISPSGLCVSASHVFVDNGRFCSRAQAFGGQGLRLIASFPFHDIILLEGETLE